MKKLFLLFLAAALIVLTLPSVTAVCTCAIAPSLVYNTETVSYSCSCNTGAEQNKAYTLYWTNTTNQIVETDSGTTAISTAIFSNTYTVPSGARNGIYNATLTVLGIFKDYDEFTVTNATSFEKLSITSIIANNISLGRKASLVAQVQADTEGYVANAQCMVTVLTPFSTVLETQEGTTVGGDGHIVFAFDTEKWSDTVRSYVGEQVDYYLECNCFPNCTAGSYEKGCCVGRVTDGADSKPILNFHFADSFIPVTVTANETEPTATVTLTLLLLSFGIVLLYIWLGTVWAIEIFNPKERQNIVKVLFMWLGLWLIPLILNIILILLDYAGIGTKLVDMFTLLYDISMWVDYIVTAIMIIFLVYNSVIWLSTAFGNKGRQK